VLKKCQAHINVEACNQTYLIKCLLSMSTKDLTVHRMRFKNRESSASESTKGDGTVDQEKTSSDGIDEIAEYMKSRYLSCCEDTWRLFGFEFMVNFLCGVSFCASTRIELCYIARGN
jgi:hypothetical protein